MTPAATALAEYTRRKERAAIDVANRPALRDRAEANLRAWLAIVILTGGDHADATRAMEPYQGDGWTDRQVRTASASYLCPNRSWARHLAHEVDSAVAAAKDDASITRARQLLALARHLHVAALTSAPPSLPSAAGNEGHLEKAA